MRVLLQRLSTALVAHIALAGVFVLGLITTVLILVGGVGRTNAEVISATQMAGTTFISDSQLLQVVDTVSLPGPEGISLGPFGFATNPATGYVYVANSVSNDVTVLSGTKVITTVPVGSLPIAIGVNPASGYVYVVNRSSWDVTVLSGTNVITTLKAGMIPVAIGVNPVSGYAYVANSASGGVTVISGTEVLNTIEAGLGGQSVGVSPYNGYAYVSNWRAAM